MARPRTKGDPIHIRLTENDHARYTAHAEAADVSLAFYITNVLAGALQFLDGTLTGVRADVVRDQLTNPVGVARMRERAERLEAGQAKTVPVDRVVPTVHDIDEAGRVIGRLDEVFGLGTTAAVLDSERRVLAGEGLRINPGDDLEEKLADLPEAWPKVKVEPYEDGSAWANPSEPDPVTVSTIQGHAREATVIVEDLPAEAPAVLCQHPKSARKTTAAGMMICSCGMVKGPDGTWRTP